MLTRNDTRDVHKHMGPAMPSQQEIDAVVAGARRAQSTHFGRLLSSYTTLVGGIIRQRPVALD